MNYEYLTILELDQLNYEDYVYFNSNMLYYLLSVCIRERSKNRDKKILCMSKDFFKLAS